jgi:hypothetical protein
MKHSGLGGVALAALAGLALAGPATAQDAGVKQVEALVKASGSTVQAITEAKLQLLKTMDVYNGLLADDAKDRKKLYRSLQKEMDTTESRRAEITRRSGLMANEAQALFKSWEASAAGIADEGLRRRSEERLAKTKASYEEIRTVGDKAGQLYAPVMKSLGDKVKYLGHDLNPEAVASLRPDAQKLNQQVQELVKAVDDTVATANRNIGALRPQ